MTDGEQLKLFIENQKKSKTSIAKDLKITRTTLYQYFESRILEEDTKKKFEELFGTPIFKEELPNQTGEPTHPFRTKILEKKNGHSVDTVANRTGEVEAGKNISIQDSPDYIEGFIQMKGIGPNDGSWIVRGNSMEPRICKGSRVVIRKLENTDVIAWGEIYVLDLNELGAKVKYIMPGSDKDHYLLVSENEVKNPSFEVHRIEDVISIYRVLAVLDMM